MKKSNRISAVQAAWVLGLLGLASAILAPLSTSTPEPSNSGPVTIMVYVGDRGEYRPVETGSFKKYDVNFGIGDSDDVER